MIYLANFQNYSSLKCDEVWAIVRSLNTKPSDVRQVSELSPSKGLFYKYLDLKKKNMWGTNSFNEIYVPQFLQEIKENRTVTSPLLNYLYSADKHGKNIALLCFCSDEELCHRSIIGGLLQGVGISVQTGTGNDYKRYFDMYSDI